MLAVAGVSGPVTRAGMKAALVNFEARARALAATDLRAYTSAVAAVGFVVGSLLGFAERPAAALVILVAGGVAGYGIRAFISLRRRQRARVERW